MDINEVVSKMGYVNDLINSGRFDSAYENVKEILGNFLEKMVVLVPS